MAISVYWPKLERLVKEGQLLPHVAEHVRMVAGGSMRLPQYEELLKQLERERYIIVDTADPLRGTYSGSVGIIIGDRDGSHLTATSKNGPVRRQGRGKPWELDREQFKKIRPDLQEDALDKLPEEWELPGPINTVQ